MDARLVDTVDHHEVLKEWLISGVVVRCFCRKCSVLLCLSLDFLRFEGLTLKEECRTCLGDDLDWLRDVKLCLVWNVSNC